MRKLSVLFTNNTLSARAGSETYVRDVALALVRRRCHPVAFSLVLGPVAEELRRATVPVVDNLARLGEPPDVIHGHHHLETLIAALTFPGVPVVHFCHGWIPWEEKPLRHPSIRKYVAVDEVCLDRLIREEGIPREQTELLLNFVDLDRFRPRGPLPRQPARALVLSNGATSDGYARVIRAACADHGVSLDIVGLRNGNPSDAPETLLHDYDLVFAKGRAALESLAVGCAVVLADTAGCGPLVTPDNFDRLRMRNFGIRELVHAHEAAWYGDQIAAYRAEAAAQVSCRVRAEAGLEAAVDRLLAIYQAAMTMRPVEGDSGRAAAEHLRVVGLALKQAHDSANGARVLTEELGLARSERDSLQLERAGLRDSVTSLTERAGLAERNLEASLAHAKALEEQVAAYRALPTLRIRDAVSRLPLVGPALQVVVRALVKVFRLPPGHPTS
jgi:glycosyltransferase involved in cell wall biosynthesis